MKGMMFELVKDGRPNSAIVIGRGKDDESFARLLAQNVSDISGVEIPIIGENESLRVKNFIHLGTLSEHSSGLEILREKRCMVSWKDREEEQNKRLNIPADLGDQGFVFHAIRQDEENHLVLGGYTAQGTLYAAVTAAERLCLDRDSLVVKYIDTVLQPRFNIPLFKHRSVATNLGGPDGLRPGQWEKEWRKPDGSYDWRGFVDFLVSHKLNNLNCWIFNLAFGIAYNSARFPEMVNRHHPNVKQEFMYDLMEYAAQRHIDTWFMLGFPDNWAGVIKERPHFAGKNIDLDQFPKGEAWDSYAQGDSQVRAVRRSVGWVCGAEPEVKQFWREYLEELVERYPQVRGIGGQFGEHSSLRCTCPVCSERFFDIQREFFEELVKTVQAKNPAITPWMYDSWGAPEIVRAADQFPHFLNIDWGDDTDCLKFHSRCQVPRSTWYLQHASGSRWREYLLRLGTRTLATFGLSGYQIRGVSYREQDEMYHAAQEFAWNPALSEDGFALLHIIRRYHHEDSRLTKLYASWIKINGRKELLRNADSFGWIDHAQERSALNSELSKFETTLRRMDKRDGFVADIVEAFERSRKELHALATGK